MECGLCLIHKCGVGNHHMSYSFDCSYYSGFLSNLGLDSDSDSSTCSDTYCFHIVPTVVDFVDSHTEPDLLSSAPTDNP